MRWIWALAAAVPVLAAGGPTLAIAPASLNFACQSGSQAANPQAVVLSSGQSGVFTASRPAQQTWLVLPTGTPAASGNIPGIMQIGVNPSGLGPGTYTSAISFHTPQGNFDLPVTLLVTPAPVLVANPPMLLFDSIAAGQNQQTVAVGLSNGQQAVLSFQPSAPWITTVPDGNAAAVGTNVSKASGGMNSGSVIVSGPNALGAANNPLAIPVVYIVGTLNRGGPLALSPASLAFTSAGSQTVTVTGPAFTAAANVPWLAVAASGQSLTVSASTCGLAAGNYQGTVAITSAGVVELLPVSLTVAAAPAPQLVQVSNAASYANGSVAPGEVIALFGSNVGPSCLTTLQLDANGLVSSKLAGVQVLFNGTAAPLIYVSAGQVAAVAPYELDGQASAAVQVVVNGQGSNTVTVPVGAAAPGIFTADASGAGPGAILNPDNTVNGPGNPAPAGSTVAVYMTGEGQTKPAGMDGQVTSAAPPAPRQTVTATIDGQPAAVVFAGEAPALVSGVMQVNVTIPANARSGALSLVVSVGGVPSQTGVTVSVR